ncbi:MAG: protein phosphatase 2C domain-containing protein [Chloroflexi bacterium]|nr:protein phosphatase 2C domain-containing protein [Chloroflexota bacterium]
MFALTTFQARGAIVSDPGRLRPVNEDWCGSLDPDEAGEAAGHPSVWIVADGLSQHGTGRDAARLAVETFLRAGWDHSGQDYGATLQTAAQQANQRLWELGQQARPAEKRWATTVVAAVLRDGETWILAAGDCRAYLLRAGTIRQITRDHTLAAEEVRLGRLRPDEAEHHPGRHTLLRCLGNRPTVQPDLFHERLMAGDRLLLCSDGLFRHVADAELLRIGSQGDPRMTAHRLLELANQRGGTDNITVGIVEIAALPEHEGREWGTGQATTMAPPLSSTSPPLPPASPWPIDSSAHPASNLSTGPSGRPSAAGLGGAMPATRGHAASGMHPEPPVSRLAVLSTAARWIGSHPGLAETLDAILAGALAVAEARRAAILLADEPAARPVFAAGRGLTAADLAADLDARPDADHSTPARLVEQVLQSGQPILAGDAVVADPGLGVQVSANGHGHGHHAGHGSGHDLGQGAALCVPLVAGERCIGALYADAPSVGTAFTLVDLDLLTTFASLSAAAIDSAQLRARYEQQVRQIGSLQTAQDRILRSVSSGIIAVDREGVITSCNRAAAEMLLVDPSAVVGTPLGSILPPRFMLALGAPFAGSGDDPGVTIQGFDMVGELRGRGYVHFEHRLSPLKDDAGGTVGYVLALEDRTFLARLERERREAGAERERIMRIFGGMMSPDVLQEVLRIGGEGSGFGGDRRTLTIMFADIRGFTGLSERLPPEDVVEILNGYLGAATDVILEHKGSIDKYIGDAVMALFGAPAPLENHALQAVRAALAMQKRFAERPAPEGHRASFGIGINTGSGIVGMIGSPDVKSYTAIGDVVNVAARLEGEARAGEVLITDDTYQLVHDDVEVEGLGSIYVKGRVTPVAVYKVLRVREAAERAPAGSPAGRHGERGRL